MFLLENLVAIIVWVLIAIVAVNFVFLCFVFYRRLSRTRYFEAKDAGRERYRSAVSDFLQGALSFEHALLVLRKANTPAERHAVRELLLSQITAATAHQITEMLYELGMVAVLAREAFGRSRGRRLAERARKGGVGKLEARVNGKPTLVARMRSLRMFAVPRALAVDGLGRLAPEVAAVFMTEALGDPSADVRRVAIAAMGHHVAALPLLLEELRRAIEEGNDLSLRSTKSALVRYRLEDLSRFLPYLRHRNRRLRFFVTDIIREIANRAARKTLLNKNDFSLELYEAFQGPLMTDDFPDVRARAAVVIRHFRDEGAVRALRVLLRDPNEFVRLHAVRATADPYYSALLPTVVELLADPKWRVREAAAHALAIFGRPGINQLYRTFVATDDLYASEQIAEEIQRGGFAQDLVAVLAAPTDDARLALAVCTKLVILGKTSLLTNAAASEMVPVEARLQLMDLLMGSPNDHFVSVLNLLARKGDGQVGAKAKLLLQNFTPPAAAAAAGGG